MFDSLFTSVLQTESSAASLTSGAFLACTLASLVLGVVIALVYTFRHEYSKNFVVTLALLPLIVQVVITLVNGNLGAGIAVMGVFNLVRFRSIPGTAKDIGAVFMAMAIGLATGMGFLWLAAIFTLVVGIANVAFVLSPLGAGSGKSMERSLKVSIPEDMNYAGAFDDIFARYTTAAKLISARTTNMGSLYQLDYHVTLKNPDEEKKLMDAARTRNGNLSVQCGMVIADSTRL